MAERTPIDVNSLVVFSVLQGFSSMLLLTAALKRIKRNTRKKRTTWMKNWLASRRERGAYSQIMSELQLSDVESYRRYIRMDVAVFQELLERTKPFLTKKETVMRSPISAEEYLAVTLRFLATGESYSSLSYQFRISQSTLTSMVPYTCSVIYKVLVKDFLHCPSTTEEWLTIAKGFQEKWQFPNCIGAGDGKHIRLKCPSNTGSEYYNYKGYYSLVLLAFVGPNYEFLYVDVGSQGSSSDAGILRKTSLWEALESEKLNIPPASPLPQSAEPVYEDIESIKIEHFFVCDDAFPLGMHLMKPYSKRSLSEEQRIFNYRLSRARRVSENAFGIMAARFRVLHSMMCLSPENATNVTLACCALHNMLVLKLDSSYTLSDTFDQEDAGGNFKPGTWRATTNTDSFQPLQKSKERCSRNAEDMRNTLCEFVNGPGSIPWQYKAVIVPH